MDMIPLPEIVTQQISRRAVEIAQIIGPRKTGKGLTSIQPFWEEGIIGIEVPDDKKYLLDLDEGIREHPMSSLEGLIIPVRSPGGSLYFRRATEENIGQTPIINRSAENGKISDGKPEWVYPSKEGLNFIQRSLQQSVDEWTRSVKSNNILNMLLQTRVKNDVSMVVYGREIT
jgi:hypothetical protein